MPELPEVESVRRGLESAIVGQKILSIEVLRDKSWQGDVDLALGAEIVSVERKAKVLFIAVRSNTKRDPSPQQNLAQDGNYYLMIHLKMTGQLMFDPSYSEASVGNVNKKHDRIVGGHPSKSWIEKLPDSHTRVIIHLENGTLYFNDMRVFGWVKVVTSEWVTELMHKMPPDIIDPECDKSFFYQLLQKSRRPVKVVIMDSGKVGGVGNIYACDGLFDAGINPKRPAQELSREESDRLLTSLKKVVGLGIELGGATAHDGKFLNTQGMGGRYQDHFLVYEQEGEIRERGGITGVVEKYKLAGRGTYWVPKLQS